MCIFLLQHVCVFDTESIFKRVLTLDGVIQVTTHDECSYQEMITHLPLCALPVAAKRVLIIGGGDGGVAREVAKHSSVETIDMVEIDGTVPEVSKRYFPQLAVGLQDPRLRLHIQDGVKWLQEAKAGTYDAIIVDSSDPIGPAAALFEQPFMLHAHRALRPGGVLCTQAESLWLHIPLIQDILKAGAAVFDGGSVHYAFTTIPTYPSGQIGFMICCKADSEGRVDAREARRTVPGGACRYYSKSVHQAAFALPVFAAASLSEYLSFQ